MFLEDRQTYGFPEPLPYSPDYLCDFPLQGRFGAKSLNTQLKHAIKTKAKSEVMEMIEFETHTGKVWKCGKEDVLEIFESLLKGLAGERNDHCIRVTDTTGEHDSHLWGVTRETAERISRETGLPIGNEEVKTDDKQDDATQDEDTVELGEKVLETQKAVLSKVIIRVEGAEKTWETWIPKSVIEEGRIAEWFQDRLLERFADETAGRG